MKAIILFIVLLLICQLSGGQDKYMTQTGFIRFYSHTLIEDITANNEKVAALIDSEKGALAIVVLMNEFQFEKKLMQEHFNENYVESEKYPKATFSGRIENHSEVNYQNPGTYQVQVSGEMYIHGVTREVATQGTIEVTEKGITAKTKFLLNPEDYGIRIPRVVRKNIAEKMEITAELICDPI
jgi:polyisoprenoid-binding protein YceI